MSATSALAAAPVAAVDEPAKPDTATPSTEAIDQPQPTETEAKAKATTEHATPPDSPAAPTERDQAITRIRQSALPAALRERLAAVMESSQSPHLDIAVCLEAIEQTLPDFLRDSRQIVAQPAHPAGDAFFNGSEELTDAEAETLAQRQLARSGLLRGQRVHVGD